jgi:hypothetical protein
MDCGNYIKNLRIVCTSLGNRADQFPTRSLHRYHYTSLFGLIHMNSFHILVRYLLNTHFNIIFHTYVILIRVVKC